MSTRQKAEILLVLLFVLFLFLASVLSGLQTMQPSEEWVVTYNGPGSSQDYPWEITVDKKGNVFVTGESYGSGTHFDYATIKYDKNGNEEWVAKYDSLDHFWDSPRAITLDSRSNVYVTGHSYMSSTDEDIATVKYDKNGNELWVSRYDSPGDSQEIAEDIAVDKKGNVYVTGSRFDAGVSGSADIITLKYDKNGNELWISSYNGPGNAADESWSLAIDKRDNVYITGYSVGIGTSSDFVTIKYDSNGNELWVARYNGPGNSHDNPRGIVVDKRNNVYITGWSHGIGTDKDYATIKYDNDGNELWNSRYNGLNDSTDLPSGVGVDAHGNVYVTGFSLGDFTTIKYDASGNELWIIKYDGPGILSDNARPIFVDKVGNVYVSGTSSGVENFDFATVKYDSNGNELWIARYNGPENSGDGVYDMTVDNKGNVYVTGSSHSSGTLNDFTTIKYKQIK